ncbi:ABC transporter ATP-binding protein [Clostridium senegalense]|uniref:ATP-binding cassette domain-containing protein n=1 Tax=Clostridium senegalense TaxID=1465809 RepID=A0A6M0GZZ3_9CLOT|nr:ATP-binding cassette domain-containing protein [Clostridium senegalense]NEU04110.1 ATP-binding cassette domain-containing protein [Clostridium senegalense]
MELLKTEYLTKSYGFKETEVKALKPTDFIPILFIEENIKLSVLMDGRKVDEDYFNEIMETLGLTDRKRHLSGEVSGGQQRVSIARALITKPSIIFADEPTGNLDSKNSKEVMDLLAMSIMITHDPKISERADRIITISDGEISGDRRTG